MPEFDVEALRARFPGPVHRAGRAAGGPVRRARRHPGPGHGDRGRRALLPRREREPRRPVPHLASAATRCSTRRTSRSPTCSTPPSPDEIKFGANMTTLTMHLARSITASLQPGDVIAVTSLDHEANVGPVARGGRGPRDRGPHRRHPPRRRDPRHRGVRHDPPRAPEARRVRLGVQRGRDDQPGRRARPPRPRGGQPHLRRRGPRRAPRPDRRPGHRDGLPRLLGLQVLRAPRRACSTGAREVLDALPTYRLRRRRRPVRDRDPQPRGDRRLARRGRVHRGGGASGSGRRSRAGFPGMAGRRLETHAGMAAIRAYEMALFGRLLDGLEAIPGARVWGITDRCPVRRAHADRRRHLRRPHRRGRLDGAGRARHRDLVGQLLRHRPDGAARPRARGRASGSG